MNVINFSKPITGNFFVDVIIWLVGITSSVAGGIILFTILLKIITLPFDFMSRYSMRKNSLLMEDMRPELERLQKQYANNKDLYSQKMMALYKKNGYSVWGSCLPTILTLVIFIVAINGFNAYSQYQNRVYFYEMSNAYNNVIYSGFEVDNEYLYFDEQGKLVVNDGALYQLIEDNDVVASNHKINFYTTHGQNGYKIYTENGFIKYTALLDHNGEISSEKYELIKEKLFNEKGVELSNNEISFGFELDGTYIKKDTVNKKIVFDKQAMYELAKSNNGVAEINAGDHKILVTVSGRTMTVYTENGYVKYQTAFSIDGQNQVVFDDNADTYYLIEEKLFNEKASEKESNEFYFGFETDANYVKVNGTTQKLEINASELEQLKTTKLTNKNIYIAKTELGYTMYTENGYMQYFRDVAENSEKPFNNVSFAVRGQALKENTELKILVSDTEVIFAESNLTPEQFLAEIQGTASAEAYRANQAGFLWVKNLWIADGAHKHPVLEYYEFKTIIATEANGCGCNCAAGETSVPISEEEYNKLTAKLEKEKSEPNGFYILCVLSAVISLVSQIVLNKSQKAQLELQTVDGQGAQSQKMMTWMLPIMMAFFSFIYTSAFSIYIIINSLLTLGTTFAINGIVDFRYKKNKKSEAVVRGRVYTPPQQQKKSKREEKKNKKEQNKEREILDRDFLTGLADKKRKNK